MPRLVVTGAINWDINLFIQDFPRIGEEVPVVKITRVAGGKGANAAVAAARILGKNQVALIGAIGKDEIGRMQLRILRDEHVLTPGIKVSNHTESGQAYIAIDNKGRNVIHTLFGANMDITAEDFRGKKISSLIESSQVVVIVDPPMDAIKEITSQAGEAGKTVIWDAGVRSKLGFEELRSVLKRVDYLLLNEIEYENVFGAVFSEDAPRMPKLQEMNLKVLVKLGERGAILFDKRRMVKVEGINLEKHGLKVVNTVGCGDAFLGAFASYISLGRNEEQCLAMANLAGAFKATRPETRGSPTKKQLMDLMKRIQ